jgi:uncharacterized protein with HEPN domain
MLDAIAALDRYGDRDRESFDHDELLQVWFLRHLQILGEAAAGLPQELRDLAPDVPWPSIVGMRNVLVHGYFDIDADIVWEAARRDVPALRPALLRLLRELEDRKQ